MFCYVENMRSVINKEDIVGLYPIKCDRLSINLS